MSQPSALSAHKKNTKFPFRVYRQGLTLSLDFASRTITGVADLTIVVRSEPELRRDGVVLHCRPGCAVLAAEVNGVAAKVERRAPANPAPPPLARDYATFVAHYRATQEASASSGDLVVLWPPNSQPYKPHGGSSSSGNGASASSSSAATNGGAGGISGSRAQSPGLCNGTGVPPIIRPPSAFSPALEAQMASPSPSFSPFSPSSCGSPPPTTNSTTTSSSSSTTSTNTSSSSSSVGLSNIKLTYRVNLSGNSVVRWVGHSPSHSTHTSTSSQATAARTQSESSDSAQYMYICAGLGNSPCWMPCIDNSNDRPIWVFAVTVPEDMLVVAPGKLTKISSPGPKLRTFHYSLDIQTLPRHIGLAAGYFEGMQDPNVPSCAHLVPAGMLHCIEPTTSFIGKAFKFYEQFLDWSFPYPFYTEVFVRDAPDLMSIFAGLSIFDSSLLLSPDYLHEGTSSREALSLALAQQWFGSFISFKQTRDLWLLLGISEFLASHFLTSLLGLVYGRYITMKRNDYVVEKEWCTPLSVTIHDYVHPCELQASKRFTFKSALVIDVLDKKCGTGGASMQKFLRSILKPRPAKSKSSHKQPPSVSPQQPPTQQTNVVMAPPKKVLSHRWFLNTLSSHTGQDLKAPVERWLYGRGYPPFLCGFQYDKKKKHTKFVLKLDMKGRHPDEKISGNIVVCMHEADGGTYNHTVGFDGEINMTDLECHARFRKARAPQQPPLKESPLLWVRIDPEYDMIRKILFKQSEVMWIAQLETDKDVRAQSEAAKALAEMPTRTAISALANLLSDDKAFWAVRAEAAWAISKTTTATSAVPSAAAPHDLTQHAFEVLTSFYCSRFFHHHSPHSANQNSTSASADPSPQQTALKNEGWPAPHDFRNFSLYLVKKSIPPALGLLCNPDGTVYNPAFKFLLLLLKANDNSHNEYSDSEFIASVLNSLASLKIHGRGETRSIEKQARRFLEIDRILPSKENVVTCACLGALSSLQAEGQSPPDLNFFWDYARYQSPSIRAKALQCIAQLALQDQFGKLLLAIQSDTSAKVQLLLVEYLISIPRDQFKPFATKSIANQTLVNTMWEMMCNCPDYLLRSYLLKLYKHIWGVGTPQPVFKQDVPALSQVKQFLQFGRKNTEYGFVVKPASMIPDTLDSTLPPPPLIPLQQSLSTSSTKIHIRTTGTTPTIMEDQSVDEVARF
ncbi:transcription initiation factor TFIID subunit 2 [Pelomyxa schiedti]|nr:transcription initiation factor TFIID subunit 2 [Pelomyxa schiedti]